jgi:hypothetical protein
MSLPPELAFLEPHLAKTSDIFRTAMWLKSEFEDNIWSLDFNNKNTYIIDWNIHLDNGTPLIHKRNSALLASFKYILILSTRNNHNPTYETNKLQSRQHSLFRRACLIIDYLLINGKALKLSAFGLAGLTSGDLKRLLDRIASTSDLSLAIYEWPQRLQFYCIKLLDQYTQKELDSVLDARPMMKIVTEEQLCCGLEFPRELIPKVRAALFLKGAYKRQLTHSPLANTLFLSSQIYPDTILGKKRSKPSYEILCIDDSTPRFVRELPGASVTNSHARQRKDSYNNFRAIIYRLGMLRDMHLPTPAMTHLLAIENYTPEVGTPGRFKTLPTSVAFSAIKNAIEFHIIHGAVFLDAYCSLLIECKKLGISPSDITDEQFMKTISEDARSRGVNRVGLSVRLPTGRQWQQKIKLDKAAHFKSLRKNNGLLEMVSVYIGCVQIVVGALMAKRASELVELPTEHSLDSTETWLLAFAGKSTKSLFGLRKKIARPIDPIAVSMIKNLQNMQHTLVEEGCIAKPQRLFSTPHLSGQFIFKDTDHTAYNKNLDNFCDYFQTQTNRNQERYYIRQHQLRRFFAMVFFYNGSFGQLDTLRWMLGHEEAIHIWHYITETMGGATLRSASAQFLAEQLQSEPTESFRELSNLLSAKYGTDEFAILDTEDLQSHIDDLIKEGIVRIEPFFFTDEKGQKMQIIVKVLQAKTSI